MPAAFWGTLPDWLVALGTLGSFYYLIDYARTAKKQLEAGVRPVVVIGEDEHRRYYFKNIGPGPALNACWTYAHDIARSVEKRRTAIEVNSPYAFGDSISSFSIQKP